VRYLEGQPQKPTKSLNLHIKKKSSIADVSGMLATEAVEFLLKMTHTTAIHYYRTLMKQTYIFMTKFVLTASQMSYFDVAK
jgi:hypothetical protein